MDDSTQTQTRVECDNMGTVELPANVYWGTQTARSLKPKENRHPDNVLTSFSIPSCSS